MKLSSYVTNEIGVISLEKYPPFVVSIVTDASLSGRENAILKAETRERCNVTKTLHCHCYQGSVAAATADLTAKQDRKGSVCFYFPTVFDGKPRQNDDTHPTSNRKPNADKK